MSRRPSWLALLVAAALVALSAAAPAAAEVPEGFYGVNGQSLFLLPSHQWDDHLEEIADAGLDVVRRDASWNSAEPHGPTGAAHTYNWTGFDRDVTHLARHGLRWLPVVAYSTEWSGEVAGDYFSPPRNDSDYAAYAAALARRYGRGGQFWQAHPELPQLPVTSYEIWNEQNTEHFWHPQRGAAERYADLYMAARAAVRAVDPAARVMVGGLALENEGVTNEGAFVRRMYAHRPDLVGNVDAIGLHPYTPDAAGVLAKVREFRRTLLEVGAAEVPIEITEVGWTTAKTSEQDRAAALSRLAEELPRSDCGVTSFIPHTWVTEERTQANVDDWFGIWNRDGTAKPSGRAYAAGIAAASGADSSERLGHCKSPAAQAQPAAPVSVRRLAPPRQSSDRPRLRLRVRRAGAGRVVATVWCPEGCRVTVNLTDRGRSGQGASRRALPRRTLPSSARERTLVVRVPRGWRAVRLTAKAVAVSGHAIVRTRTVRVS